MKIQPPPVVPQRAPRNSGIKVTLGGGGYGPKQLSTLSMTFLIIGSIALVAIVWSALANKSRYDHMTPEEKQLQALVDSKPFKVSNGLAYEADRYLQLNLNDYSSLEVVYSSDITLASDNLESPTWKQTARIRAANGFGAKTISDVTFYIDGSRVQSVGLQ